MAFQFQRKNALVFSSHQCRCATVPADPTQSDDRPTSAAAAVGFSALPAAAASAASAAAEAAAAEAASASAALADPKRGSRSACNACLLLSFLHQRTLSTCPEPVLVRSTLHILVEFHK